MSERIVRSVSKVWCGITDRLTLPGFSELRRRLEFILVAFCLISPMTEAVSQSLAPVRVLSTYAGNGTNADAGDGGLAINAEMGALGHVVMDKAGNLYVAEISNHIIRKISANGIITTVAGTSGQSGSTGDGGPATQALLDAPAGLTIDNYGNLLIVDQGNETIRKVDSVTGTISTIAGTPGIAGYTGDGGLATSATLHEPYGVACDKQGNLYIADYTNQVIRKIDATGKISTFAGNGTHGYKGDGGDRRPVRNCMVPTVFGWTPSGIYISRNIRMRLFGWSTLVG